MDTTDRDSISYVRYEIRRHCAELARVGVEAVELLFGTGDGYDAFPPPARDFSAISLSDLEHMVSDDEYHFARDRSALDSAIVAVRGGALAFAATDDDGVWLATVR